MTAMLKSIALLTLVGVPALADAKTLSMPMYQNREARNVHTRSRLAQRNTAAVTVVNSVQNGLYYVNATVGTPGQTIQLQIDTGSSDIWMFSPQACQQAGCVGFDFNIQKSSSAQVLVPNGFQIQYGTPGSFVQGDYFSDNFGLGSVTVKNMTMALATKARHVPTGIMGISFDLDESIVATGQQPYPNLVDVMVTQGLISTHSYSLYLDDLEAATGSVLFGGYDTAKYTGNLGLLQIQPDAQTGTISTMTVALTSVGIEDAKGPQSLTPSNFAAPALLDSGTTLTLLPPAMYQALATYFGAVEDQAQGIAIVDCDVVDNSHGSVNFGFGGKSGPVIKVPYSEFAIPIFTQSGAPATLNNGHRACSFGMQSQNQPSLGIILGDTFLRSAYVVYDLDNKQISLAQSSFNSQSSNIKEIGSTSPGNSVSAAVTVTQSASQGLPPGIQSSLGIFPSSASGSITLTGSGIAGATASATPGGGGNGVPSSGSTIRPEAPGSSIISFTICGISLLTGVAFMAFR